MERKHTVKEKSICIADSVYVLLIHFVIKQKLTHHCKAIILQKRSLKKKKEKNY